MDRRTDRGQFVNDYSYDTTYDPPIPICEITLMTPGGEQPIDLRAVVDTEADPPYNCA